MYPVSGTLSCILSGTLSCTLFGILSGILSGTLSGILSGTLSGIVPNTHRSSSQFYKQSRVLIIRVVGELERSLTPSDLHLQ